MLHIALLSGCDFQALSLSLLDSLSLSLESERDGESCNALTLARLGGKHAEEMSGQRVGMQRACASDPQGPVARMRCPRCPPCANIAPAGGFSAAAAKKQALTCSRLSCLSMHMSNLHAIQLQHTFRTHGSRHVLVSVGAAQVHKHQRQHLGTWASQHWSSTLMQLWRACTGSL